MDENISTAALMAWVNSAWLHLIFHPFPACILQSKAVEQDLGGLPGDGGGDLPHRDGPGQSAPRLARVRSPLSRRRALSSWRAAHYCAAPKRRFLTVPC